MGGLSALWTPETWRGTALTLAPSGGVGRWMGRPFWRYVGPRSRSTITWVTRGRGWKAPFGTNFAKAATKLHLAEYGGHPTKVIKVPYKLLTRITRARRVMAFGKPTGAVEYYYGRLTFPKW